MSEYALQVRMSHAMHKQWASAAKAAKCSMSEWVRRAVEQYRLATAVTAVVRRELGPTPRKRPTPSPQAARQRAGEVARTSKPRKRSARLGRDSGGLPAKG